MNMHVIVIGGGITGLSAAWQLQQQAAHIRVSILEQCEHWGGKLISQPIMTPHGTAIAEGGPESFVTRKPEVWELAHELGIGAQLIAAPSEARRMRVLDAGRALAVPLDPLTFLRSPLLSVRGKVRMLLEPFIPARHDMGDESLADFVDRRLGREARERFIGPILAGIYNTDPETQSILTTAPVMRELERYGSLVKGSVLRMRERQRANAGARPPQFVTFAQGTQVLTNTLIQRLNVERHSQAQVTCITAGPCVILADGTRLNAHAVIVTTPAHIAAQLLREAMPTVATKLARIRHNNIGTLSLLYKAAELSNMPDLRGLMIPRRERRLIDAITCIRSEHSPRVPPGYVLLKVFVGASQPALVLADDTSLQARVEHELGELLGIAATPVGVRIFRWPAEFPQADVGHLELVDAIEQELPSNIFLAGASYRGIGVPDCIRQGRQAAQHALAYCSAGTYLVRTFAKG